MEKVCAKCGALNREATGSTTEACPACGAIYFKVQQGPPAKASNGAARAPRDEAKKPNEELTPLAKVLWVMVVVCAALWWFLQPPPDTSVALVSPAPPQSCGDDGKCVAERELHAARLPCSRALMGQLRYGEWDDGMFDGPRFNPVDWYDPVERTVIYNGTRLRAQNHFGAWRRLHYFCVWDSTMDMVVKAEFN